MTIFAIVIGVLGLYICVTNYVAMGISLYNRKHNIDRYVSPIVFLSGILMFASAIILLPKSIWMLAFIAFALDYTYPSFIYAVFVKGCFK